MLKQGPHFDFIPQSILLANSVDPDAQADLGLRW